ncbi:VanZ family protein [Shouchella sp. JSM 1781072]|uniref:VanZ family protein n=1 Tax=Shouchella sp. JSM 1781072 TaxID=3344581 RepID=UPI0035C11124
MVHTTLPLIYLALPVLLILFIVDVVRNKRGLRERILQVGFSVYLLALLDVTLGEIWLPPWTDSYHQVQLVPLYFLVDIYQTYEIGMFYFINAIKLSFYNLLLFVPFGMFLYLLFKLRNGLIATLVLFLASLFIEISQLVLSSTGLSMSRIFDVDDLILNTAGGVLGYYVTKWIDQLIKRR